MRPEFITSEVGPVGTSYGFAWGVRGSHAGRTGVAAAQRHCWDLRAVLSERAATGTPPVDRAHKPAGARGRGAAAGPFPRFAPSATWRCCRRPRQPLAGGAAR